MVAWKGIVGGIVVLQLLFLAQRSAAVDVKFSSEKHEKREGSGYLIVRLEVTRGTVEQPFTIIVEPVPGTANGSDYTMVRRNVEYASGTVYSFAIIEILEDSLFENSETFTLSAKVQAGAASSSVRLVSPTQTTVTIIDNSALVNFHQAEYTVREDAGFLPVCVDYVSHAIKSRTAEIMVPWKHVLPPSATKGREIEGHARPDLELDPLSNMTCVNITIHDNDECNEVFVVELWPHNTGVEVGDRNQASIVVEENDEKCIQVEFVESTATTIESFGSAIVRLRSSVAFPTSYTVNILPSSGTAKAPQDFDGSTVEVEFQPHTTETFATIPIVNDGIAETRENFKLKLTSTRVLVGQQKEMTVAIADDDVVFVKVQWLFYTVEEWWQSFWVQIQAVRFVSPEYYQPASYDFHFTVRVQTVNIIARAYYDYWPVDTIVTFAPNQCCAWVQVYLRDDTAFEIAEIFGIQLSIPDGQLGTVLTVPGVTFVTIRDNDKLFN